MFNGIFSVVSSHVYVEGSFNLDESQLIQCSVGIVACVVMRIEILSMNVDMHYMSSHLIIKLNFFSLVDVMPLHCNGDYRKPCIIQMIIPSKSM